MLCLLVRGQGVCTDAEASTSLNRASTALNRAVARSVEGPAVNMVVTAVLRVSVVPGVFDRLV